MSRQSSAAPNDSAVALAGPQRVGWTVIVSSIAAMAVIFAVVTVGTGVIAESFAVGAVLGAFCALWAGVGFGVMFTGAIAVLGNERQPGV